jgi:subtilase family serine protease
LDVTASAAQIEKAFHIKLQQYPHPQEPRNFFAPDTDPSVDDAVPILDISGLTDLSLPRPLVHKSSVPQGKPLPNPPLVRVQAACFAGNDFRARYAPNVAANGSGETVGLLEFDGYYASDVTSYESQAGLPSVPLTNVLLDGFNGSPGSANIEVALDIEVAIAWLRD